MVDLYIYYKVRDAHAPSLAPRVHAMQAGLAARHGLAPRLMRRPGSHDGLQTWMEIYPGVASGGPFAPALAAALAEAGVAQWIEGSRHEEVFMDLLTDLLTDPQTCA